MRQGHNFSGFPLTVGAGVRGEKPSLSNSLKYSSS